MFVCIATINKYNALNVKVTSLLALTWDSQPIVSK